MTGPNFVPNWSDGPCLYCGCTSLNKPEELLYCELCRRPAHITCLGSDGPNGTLLADNFFTLVCQACAGVEHNAVARAKMSTVQVLLLTLYNLHVQKTHSPRSGFYHWKIHIYNFINNHWKEIYGPESRKKKKKVVQSSLSGQLSHYSQYFESGHRTLGEGGWYRLAHTLSPAAIIARFKQEKRPQSKASASRAEPNVVVRDEEVIKKEPEEVDIKLEEEQEGRRGSWFTEVDFLKPEMRPPLELFDSGSEEDIGGAEISVKSEVFVKEELSGTSVEDTEMDGEMIIVDGLGSEVIQPQCPPPSSADPLAVCGKPTLFNKPSHPPSSQLTTIKPVHRDPATPKKNLRRLSHYEERELLKKLNRGPLSPHLHRLRRKLALRKQKLEHGLSVFNLEDKVKFLTRHGHLRIWHEQTHDHAALHQHHNTTRNRVLDRFQVSSSDVTYKRQDENTSFLVRLGGQLENNLPFIHSPYTLRKLKPFIMRDFESEPLKLRLLRELESYLHRGNPNWSPSPRASLDYCYITPQHIPAINQLARQFFWPGIDLSEVLQYPDHTCVVLYRKLVVGFGVLVPDTGFNEAYLSYLLVHPEWRRAGMATIILYHLIQTCAGKDITLHVSATNPALILYQRFGFKVEEFLSNFYDKYLPEDSPECKHAMYLRLSR
ncbi:hypothetical protein Pmani_022161 [Petrolisthes manimaculis]|uniref:N-acetyltransferase domain-containing protein n=1 Tax=Petrolisthes manimaculis TaxID=1843537 RepID=A0AAE1PEW5_9EUCA|nr:hypothetical protein Pmani_022161 [Petrolisthes manimaculis]